MSKIINSLFLVIFIIKNLINIFYLKNNISKTNNWEKITLIREINFN